MFDLINFKNHPKDNKREIFFFYEIEKADYLEQLLQNSNIDYERDEEFDENKEKKVHYFLVNKHEHQRVLHLNYLTLGKYRKPFVSDVVFRYFLLFVTVGLVVLATVGYLLSNN